MSKIIRKIHNYFNENFLSRYDFVTGMLLGAFIVTGNNIIAVFVIILMLLSFVN